jgi:hypothetical protein
MSTHIRAISALGLFLVACGGGSSGGAGGTGGGPLPGGSGGGAGTGGTGGAAPAGGSGGQPAADASTPPVRQDAARPPADAAVPPDLAPPDAPLPTGDGGLAAFDRTCTPKFTLELLDMGPKGQLFLMAMGGTPQAVEQTVQQIGRDICRTLYRRAEEVRPANEIELTIEDVPGVAGKSGDIGKISVSISSRYLQDFKNGGGDVAREIKGILYHEMTHMYQNDDKPEGTWSGLANYYEADADAVRIRFGYAPTNCRPNKSGQWQNLNYCGGGWWWLWVDTKYPDFLYKLNQQLKGRDGKAWTPADATSIAGVTLDDMWKEYQAAACCSGTTTTCCK